MAQPLSIDFIPCKTGMLKPEEGHLVVKIIKKCQILRFENEIYQLTDNKGNYYVMHATETGMPNLDVILPKGWTLKKVSLQEPLVILPFGKREDCYFNIVGDHLGPTTNINTQMNIILNKNLLHDIGGLGLYYIKLFDDKGRLLKTKKIDHLIASWPKHILTQKRKSGIIASFKCFIVFTIC